MRHSLTIILFSALALFSSLAFFSNLVSAASYDKQINSILSASEMPEGVVFEIVSGDSSALRWALPKTKKAIDKLRLRFPEIPIAVVTHGQEQFALQKKNQQRFKQVHSLTESLVKDSGVNLHVCGTYAEMHGVDDKDFASYANVAAAGPAAINDYVSLGYIKILIKKDTD